MGKKYSNTTYNFEQGLSINAGYPADDRLVVRYKTDLTDGNTITSTNAYKGMIVAVVDDSTTSNNGLYQLTDVTDLNSGWVKIADKEDVEELISVKADTSALTTLNGTVTDLTTTVSGKQDALSAGNGICICSNIINNIRTCYIQ